MSSDFFMRQIEGISDVLSTVMFGKKASNGEEEGVYETNESAGSHTLLIDLRFLLNQDKINEAENLLFEQMESDLDTNYYDVAMRLYDWLEQLTDKELTDCGYSRSEIGEGRQSVRKFYGVER